MWHNKAWQIHTCFTVFACVNARHKTKHCTNFWYSNIINCMARRQSTVTGYEKPLASIWCQNKFMRHSIPWRVMIPLISNVIFLKTQGMWQLLLCLDLTPDSLAKVMRRNILNTLCFFSLSGRTSYENMSRILEAAKFLVRLFQSLWNLTSTLEAAVPRRLTNSRTIRPL